MSLIGTQMRVAGKRGALMRAGCELDTREAGDLYFGDIVKVIDGRLEEATPPIVRGRRRPASEWRFGGPAWRQQRTPALA